MAHDFEKHPELCDEDLDIYYFASPHKQIFEDFEADVTKVIDGDTILVKWSERDFEFPIRFANIGALELNEGGNKAQSWLEKKLLHQHITVKVDKNNRVEKWGRLLGNIIFQGMDIGEEAIIMGMAVDWSNLNDGKIRNPIKSLEHTIKEPK